MGISTQSIVAFVCEKNESYWASEFEEAIRNQKTAHVPGAGYWEFEDQMSVPIYHCKVEHGGRVIILDSDFYGLICPARMNLPVSLQAVVCQSWNCQGEEQDPIYAVKAENIRTHDFSDQNPAVKPYWFNYEGLNSDVWDCDEEDYKEAEAIEAVLEDVRKRQLTALVAEVMERDDLITPFIDDPHQKNIAGYLKSIGHEDSDPEQWYVQDIPLPPSLNYSNTEVIGLKSPPVMTGMDLSSVIRGKIKTLFETRAKTNKEEAIKVQSFAPERTDWTREEYALAFKNVSSQGKDPTGITEVLKTIKQLGPVGGPQIKGYILERLESPTSPVGKQLYEARTGKQVYDLVMGLYYKNRWTDFSVIVPAEEAPAQTQITYKDKHICVTGKLSKTRKEVEQQIEDAGGVVASGVSKTTDLLIAGTDAGSKLEKAKELGIPVLSEAEFEAAISGASTGRKPFVFDPDFDYYPLFEMCMGDGTTEVLDDPEDFDEFIQAIKDGRYQPGKGITPDPSKPVVNEPEPVTTASVPQTEADDEKEVLAHAEFFEACLEDCNLDEIFADPYRWAFHIEKNIAEIADLYNEENAYALTGAEPEWMVKLFKKNNVSIEAAIPARGNTTAKAPVVDEPQIDADSRKKFKALIFERATASNPEVHALYRRINSMWCLNDEVPGDLLPDLDPILKSCAEEAGIDNLSIEELRLLALKLVIASYGNPDEVFSLAKELNAYDKALAWVGRAENYQYTHREKMQPVHEYRPSKSWLHRVIKLQEGDNAEAVLDSIGLNLKFDACGNLVIKEMPLEKILMYMADASDPSVGDNKIAYHWENHDPVTIQDLRYWEPDGNHEINFTIKLELFSQWFSGLPDCGWDDERECDIYYSPLGIRRSAGQIQFVMEFPSWGINVGPEVLKAIICAKYYLKPEWIENYNCGDG